jgi:hypothetical protein
MIHADVRLDRVVGLIVPHARFLYEVERISEGQLFKAGLFHGFGIMDNDLSTDVIAVLIAL